jgi:hypothetical protein
MTNRLLGRDGARLVAAGRVAVGMVSLARPDLLPRLLGVDTGTARRMTWLGRMFGAREVALGAGLLMAGDGAAERGWVLGGVVSDAGDVLALGGALREGSVSRTFGGLSVLTAAAATGVGVMAWLDGRD